jgi:hypothetical protein
MRGCITDILYGDFSFGCAKKGKKKAADMVSAVDKLVDEGVVVVVSAGNSSVVLV